MVSHGIAYRPLRKDEIETLQQQGCSAEDWSQVEVADGFRPERVQRSHFYGRVRVGSLSGSPVGAGGVRKQSGIENACLADCTIGNEVRIANVGVHVANYAIGDGASIEDVGAIEAGPGATFGNGVEVAVLNEAGGREVLLFNELSSQIAYLMCVHRYRPRLVDKLRGFVKDCVERVRSDHGTIGAGATVRSVREMRDVAIGEHAVVHGAASLVDGTVLSSRDAPTTVGADVQAEHFIIAEGSVVDGGAMLSRTFVGQGCRVGKQFSAENSLFFANCEAFHGEACSVFGGPYTVTHHKSTLLIAGIFSFYNAGSGTNQSNHMYKLGPLHEGRIDRGSKTGSFSYMMWPCRVGAFSVVLGKHTRTFDASPFPFSHIEARADGKCSLIPGLNLTTVGTVRDERKWRKRDRRGGSVIRDRIVFDVLSPYTVGKMIEASAILKDLDAKTDRSVELVGLGGAEVKRVLLRTCQKFYRAGIHGYLLDKVMEKAEKALDSGAASVGELFAERGSPVYSEQWIDVGGQLMPKQRLDDLARATVEGRVASLEAFNAELDRIFDEREADEWAWVKAAYRQVFGNDLDAATAQDLAGIADSLLTTRKKSLNVILLDAGKEFDKSSRIGFGQDGNEDDAEDDFRQVRGEYDQNGFVKQIRCKIERMEARVAQFKEKTARL